jgi:hypothetical protein
VLPGALDWGPPDELKRIPEAADRVDFLVPGINGREGQRSIGADAEPMALRAP